MGRKIFVSYKYADGNVYPVPYISDYQPKVRDYVTWLEKKFTDRTEHIYKGEHDNEDLSGCFLVHICAFYSSYSSYFAFLYTSSNIFRAILEPSLIFQDLIQIS